VPKAIRLYVHYVDAFNTVVGKITMYVIFLMMAILLLAAIGRTVFNLSLIWTVETAQFTMAAYYLVGGAYSLILNGHVRMDLLYGRWSRRRQAATDVLTDLLLIFYLVIMIIGAVSSIDYALEYNQTSRSAWGPPLAPIKIIMGTGLLLMLLQSVSTFFKDIAAARGRTIDGDPLDE
jgi:TRAP-type mannitol/chloroaromatic compound transport system permease small subunit